MYAYKISHRTIGNYVMVFKLIRLIGQEMERPCAENGFHSMI